MARTGLEEFREVIADFKSLTSWTVKGAVVAPFADLALRVGAPWPDGVPVITSVLELLTLICVFHFWFGKSHKQLTRWMKVFLIIVCVSFFGHLYLLDTYTFVSPVSSKRYAKGFIVLPNVQRLIPAEFKTPDEVLRNSEYKEEEVWTAGSITAARLVLLAVWLTMFASLSALIATFIMAQRRKTVKAPPRRRRTKKKQTVPVSPPPTENVPAAQSARRARMILGQFILQSALLTTSASAQWNADWASPTFLLSRQMVAQEISCVTGITIAECVMSAAKSGKFTTFAKLAKASGIEAILNGPGPYTVFVPTDEAFLAFGSNKVEELLDPANGARLREILYLHAIRGNLLMRQVSQLSGSGTTAVSLQGMWLGIAKEGKVNGARILKADIEASNGTLHIIDTLIIPDTNQAAAAPTPTPTQVEPAAPKSQGRMTARVITMNSWPNEPVKIVAVKLRGGEQIKSGVAFQAVDDWVRGLTLTVTNVSQKPVCFIHVQLLLPRPPDDAGARPANDALMFVCNPVTAVKPNPLMPGMSIDIMMRDSDFVAHEALLERYQYPPSIYNLELKVLEVEFFGMKDRKWSKGQMMRQDPNSPSEWHPDSP
jgi:uncharacterized surface protein with fasciclin (FAS1) repeats